MLIRIGFFENFQDSNVVLLSGDVSALRKLAALLLNLEQSDAVELRIHEVPFVETYSGLHLVALPVSQDRGIRKSHSDRLAFTWEHSADGWREASEKIEGVAASTASGHTWLNSIGIEDARVLVSVGEYSDQWWMKHAAVSTS